MTVTKITLDTNILIYAIDNTDPIRHQKSLELMEQMLTQDCFLSLQSLCEFFYAATRKKIVPINIAYEQIKDWQELFPVICAKPTAINCALHAVEEHTLAFWDAMLWATAKDAGVTTILSEDFQHGRVLEGIKFINPFLKL